MAKGDHSLVPDERGHLRIDGNSNAKDIVLDMLRKAFPPYAAGGKFRGSRAGRQAGGLHVALSQRRNREDLDDLLPRLSSLFFLHPFHVQCHCSLSSDRGLLVVQDLYIWLAVGSIV